MNRRDFFKRAIAATVVIAGVELPAEVTEQAVQEVIDTGINNGDNYLYMAYGEDNGFSMGTYTGSGNTQSIDCGFKPSRVIVKSLDTTASWHRLEV